MAGSVGGAKEMDKEQQQDMKTVMKKLEKAQQEIEKLKTTQQQLLDDNANLAYKLENAQKSLNANQAKMKTDHKLQKELSIIKSKSAAQIAEIQQQKEQIDQLEKMIREQKKALHDHSITEENLVKEGNILNEKVDHLMKENLEYRGKIQQQSGEIARLLEESKQTDPAVKAIREEFEKFRDDQQEKYEQQMKAFDARQTAALQTAFERQQNRLDEKLDKMMGKFVETFADIDKRLKDKAKKLEDREKRNEDREKRNKDREKRNKDREKRNEDREKRNDDRDKRFEEKPDAMNPHHSPKRNSPKMAQNRQRSTKNDMWRPIGKNIYKQN